MARIQFRVGDKVRVIRGHVNLRKGSEFVIASVTHKEDWELPYPGHQYIWPNAKGGWDNNRFELVSRANPFEDEVDEAQSPPLPEPALIDWDEA